jgi:para-aminobenzoate synthetase / 4-amino-4-deoxychorismate lyase
VTGPDVAAGVFDTLLVQDGRPVTAGAHLARLAASVLEVYDVRLDEPGLAGRVHEAAERHALARLRVEFTPGTGVRVSTTDLAARPRAPWHLVVRRVPGGWGRHKWQDRGALTPPTPADDADLLLVDEDDHLLETGRGNVFVVRDGEVTTPPLDGRILPGVTRAMVLDLITDLGVGVSERPVRMTNLRAADEVFATNAIGGVRAVASCATVGGWPVGPVTRVADEALEGAWGATRDDP